EHDRLREVLVQVERAGDRARHLGGLDGMGESIPVVVVLDVDEDLGLELEAAEGPGMHDAVAVALEGRAVGMLGLGHEAARGVARAGGPGRESLALLLLVLLARAMAKACHLPRLPLWPSDPSGPSGPLPRRSPYAIPIASPPPSD